MKESTCSEDWVYDRNGDSELKVTRELFPSRVAGRKMLPDYYYLPSDVQSIYREAHAAFCSSLPIMAGFGARAIIEAVCRDKSINKGNLEKKIDQLATDGHITVEGAKILHSLRVLGNDAAHEMKVSTDEALSAAFDVVDYLLTGVYVLPRRAKKLKDD